MKPAISMLLCAMMLLVPAHGLVTMGGATAGPGAPSGHGALGTGPSVPDMGPSLHWEGGDEPAPIAKARAEDWPMWMHDIQHTGNTSSRIPMTNASLWTYDTPQQIQSSAAVVGGVVYFGSNDNNLYALWANNGTLKWKFNDNNLLDDVPSSPTVVNGKVYFFAMNVGMYCVWASNGTKIWNRTLAPANWRNFNSPLVVNDSVYIANDLPNPATIYSLNASTGAIEATKTYSEYIVSSLSYKNGKVFIGHQGGGVSCHWANNLTEFWYGRPSFDGVFSSPSISEDRVFFTSETGRLYSLYLNNGTKAWEYNLGNATYSSPVLSGDKVFVAGSAHYQSNGTRIWYNGNSKYSTPAVSGNYLVVLNGTMLKCQSVLDGSFIWSAAVTGEYASPAVTENMVVIGGNDGTMYAFSTPDITPPNVTSNTPVHQAVGVPSDANIVVAFSELMQEPVTEAAFSISPPVAGTRTWNGANLTFDPTGILASETLYTVTVRGTAMDRSGNTLDGNRNGASNGSPQDDHVFNFTTVGMAPPNVTSAQPAPGTTGVRADARVVVVFSQPMNQLITQGAFVMEPAAAGAFSWTPNSTTMTFTPAANLQDKTMYNCTVTHAALGQSGKLFDGNKDGIPSSDALDDVRWNFTVMDWIPPTVISVSPQAGAVDVPVRTPIVIGFSEPMAATPTGDALTSFPAFAGTRSWNGTSLTITLTSDLALGTEYAFTMGSMAQDLAGQRLDSDGDGTGGGSGDNFTWSFRTVDPGIPPFVESVSPLANATDVLVGADIVISFSKAMNRTLVEGAVTLDSVPAASSGRLMSWDALDRVLTMRPSVNLSYGTDHIVRVGAAAASADGLGLDGDRDGMAEGAGTDDFEWRFSTEDAPVPPKPLPRITDVHPEPDATMVPVSSNIIITFSLEMNKSSVISGVLIEPLVNIDSSWDTGGTVLTMVPVSELDSNRTYKVTVSGGVLSSEGASLDGDWDNVSEGSSGDDYSWSFRTVAEQVIPKPPVISIARPSEGDVVGGTIEIAGTASDPDTPSANIQVEMMFDDSGQWIPVGKGSNWTYMWDTTKVGDGPHKISVRAYDGSNHSLTVSRGVTVKNAKTSTSGSMSMNMPFLLLLIVIVVAIVVAVALIMRRKRGTQPVQPTVQPEPAPQPPSPEPSLPLQPQPQVPPQQPPQQPPQPPPY